VCRIRRADANVTGVVAYVQIRLLAGVGTAIDEESATGACTYSHREGLVVRVLEPNGHIRIVTHEVKQLPGSRRTEADVAIGQKPENVASGADVVDGEVPSRSGCKRPVATGCWRRSGG
jgi:hypothetical protein